MVNEKIRYGNRGMKLCSAFKFITRAGLIRPRDYIGYLKRASEYALEDDRKKIGSHVLSKVGGEFSNHMRTEIEGEIGGILPEIGAILDILSNMRKQVFTLAQFHGTYKASIRRNIVPDRDSEFVLRILFFFSVIGNEPRQKNARIFRYLSKDANFNPKESICVHRGLLKSLQLP